MTAMLFFFLLLPELELPLLLRLPYFSAFLFTFGLHFFVLFLQRLLRFRADTRFFEESARVPLPPLRVVGGVMHVRFDGGTEAQMRVFPENEIVQLAVRRLGAERNFADRQLSVFNALEDAYPERVFKEHGQTCFHCP